MRFISSRSLLTFSLAAAICSPALAINYGVYDARGLAMGGTATAVGTPAQAAYYNPALLALHNKDEDTSGDNRFYFPTLIGQASTSVNDAVSAVNDHLDTQITDAVNAFNAQADTTTAGLVATAAKDLRSVLNKIANKDLSAEAFIGLSASEPSIHEGGAFYVGVRVIGAGTSNVTQADLAVLDEYTAAMDELSKGATLAAVAAAHPTVFSGTGLVDPTPTLTSNADVSGLGISEWGLALAKEFTFWKQKIAFGMTPKMMRVDVYRDKADFQNNQVTTSGSTADFSNSKATYLTFNSDFGMIATFFDNYHISLAEKDAFAKDFVTAPKVDAVTGVVQPGLSVKLRPRSRAGLGYTSDSFSIGLDYDLKPSIPMANEAPTQDMSLGAEYNVYGNILLRAGYHQDRTGVHAAATSYGLGYRWKRFVIDIAYSQSSEIKAGGLQLGATF